MMLLSAQTVTFWKSNSAVSVSPDFRHDVPRRYKALMLFGSISSAVLHYTKSVSVRNQIKIKKNLQPFSH